MTAPTNAPQGVDVLAVFGDAIDVMYRDSYSSIPDDLTKARAAVAESFADLRAISIELRSRKINHGRDESTTLIAWAERIDAAVARCEPQP